MADEIRPIDAAIARLRASYTPGAGRPSEDVAESDVPDVQDEIESGAVPAEELLWPPTGLEALHGRVPRIAFEFAIVSFLILGSLRWTGTATTAVLLVAFLLASIAYARLRQLLLHANNAILGGYPRALVWQVAADTRGELPLVLQGKAMFTGITRGEATRIAQLRVTSAAMFALAALWIPLTIPLFAVLGFVGVMRDVATWTALLLLPSVLLVVAVRLRVQEMQLRRKFRVPEALQHELSAQIAGWNQLNRQLGIERSKSRNTLELRLAMGAVWLAAFFLLVPIALSGLTTIIPRFVSSNAPSSNLNVSVATLALMDRYRVAPDSTITATEAGQLLQTLSLAGRTQTEPSLHATSTPLPAVFPNRTFTPQTNPEFWADSLFKQIRRGLTPEQRALVESAARHPGTELMARLARAPTIDVPRTRWRLEMLDTLPLEQWPMVFPRPLRDVAHAQVAKAALLMERGALAAADTTLREVISTGFLLRDSHSGYDAVVGGTLIRIGGNALAALSELNNQSAEAGRIRGIIQAAAAATYGAPARGSHSVGDLRNFVLMRRNPLPSRWETFVLLQTAAPCLSFYSGIFGPDPEHKAWEAEARKALVKSPGDSVYFEMVSKGAAVKRKSTEPRCSPAVLRAYRAILIGY